MRIVKRVLSTYSADNFGVCSALYELGGLVVMHDASGCNSTYNTHDEPRWYDTDSMVFVSGLTEKNAIFGNDDKLIDDLVTAAEEFRPAFIAVCGGPLPHIIGTDFRAVAKAVERQCGIPTFGFQTNGMDSYISGAGQAMEALVGLMKEDGKTAEEKRRPDVNILGATPLDLSMNGIVEALRKLLEKNGFAVRSTWAMGDDLENILSSQDASVNLVVSAVGLRAAAAMKKKFGIPYVIGFPGGKHATDRILSELRSAAAGEAAEGGESNNGQGERPGAPNGKTGSERVSIEKDESRPGAAADILIIGEPLLSLSLKETLEHIDPGMRLRVLSPMHGLPGDIIGMGCEKIEREDELREACRTAKRVIADPLYARLLPKQKDKFISLPHVAYSGRYYENEVPVLVGEELDSWLDRASARKITSETEI